MREFTILRRAINFIWLAQVPRGSLGVQNADSRCREVAEEADWRKEAKALIEPVEIAIRKHMPTNEMVRRLIPLREQEDRGDSF
jgi:hypothetical protein